MDRDGGGKRPGRLDNTNVTVSRHRRPINQPPASQWGGLPAGGRTNLQAGSQQAGLPASRPASGPAGWPVNRGWPTGRPAVGNWNGNWYGGTENGTGNGARKLVQQCVRKLCPFNLCSFEGTYVWFICFETNMYLRHCVSCAFFTIIRQLK